MAGGPGLLGGVVHTDDGGLAEVVGGVGHGGEVLRIHSDVAWGPGLPALICPPGWWGTC